jgi:thiamine pyrophosphate-dependent acetolactate synthase large subunit-like protein
VLDVPGIDIDCLAEGHGCHAARVNAVGAIKMRIEQAGAEPTLAVLEIPLSP